MSFKPVRVGIVGLGHNGLAHLRDHVNSGMSEVIAVCDRNREVLQKVSAEFGVRKLYSDDRFFDDPDIEAVSVNTGDNDHHPQFQPVGVERVKGHPYLPEIQDWLTAIREDRPPRCPLHDGANSTLATLVAVRAIRDRTEVTVLVFRAQR